MASLPPTTNPLLDWLYARRQAVGFAFLGLALVVAVWVCVLLVRNWYFFFTPHFYACLATIGASVVAGVIGATAGQQVVTNVTDDKDRFRVVLISAGAVIGLALALLGLYLPFTAENYEAFTGGIDKWRQKPAVVYWPALCLLGGVVLMFLALNLARGAERASGTMRRLLYGYNVLLSSLLLLLILLLVNVLAYVRIRPFDLLATTTDWTTARQFTISDSSKALLRSLEKPVHVVVLLDGLRAGADMENLLEICRSYSPNINYESLSPHRHRDEIDKLREKHKDMPEPVGVLVKYGSDPKDYVFLERQEISTSGMNEEGVRGNEFDGENALMKSIRFLVEGKSKPKLYFLQGHGELDLDESGPNTFTTPDLGMGVLRDQLNENGFEVKALTLVADKPEIPADAAILVIARPTTALAPKELDALRDYLKGTGRAKAGKMIVLGDVIEERAGFRATGIETLVQDFGVRFKDEVLLARTPPPGAGGAADSLLLGISPHRTVGGKTRPGPTEIGRILARVPIPDPFRMYKVRGLEARDNNPAAPGPYAVEPLVFTVPSEDIWAETDLSKKPNALAADYRKNLAEFGKVRKADSLPVAFAISDKAPQNLQGLPPGHPAPPGGSNVSRMAVFGDATWISNYGIKQMTEDNVGLFALTVNWLRERVKEEEFAAGKIKYEYRLKLSSEGAFWNLVLVPGALLILGAIGLGLGVWVVRRR